MKLYVTIFSENESKSIKNVLHIQFVVYDCDTPSE